jgi:hypothetical protein
MRIVRLVAMSALVAACSSTPTGTNTSSQQVLTPTPTTTRAANPSTPKPSSAPTKAPAAGAPIADVITWIESGTPADVTGYHSATRDGETTQLDSDVAFATPSGKTSCMTDSRFGGALACLVDLADPPRQPVDVYGQWKGGWVDFEGATAEIGSAHGDPGRFGNGTGPVLPAGHTLAFGDYRCRTDQSGTYCVNYAHRSAVKFAAEGIVTFGCLTEVTPPPSDVGEKFSC